VLKIASEFVQGADAGDRSSALAGAIVALGGSLDIQAVAEGIETLEQAERMRSLGCAYGQGYLFSRPLAGAQFRSQGIDPVVKQAAPATVGPAPDEPAARRKRTRTRGSLAPNPSAG